MKKYRKTFTPEAMQFHLASIDEFTAWCLPFMAVLNGDGRVIVWLNDAHDYGIYLKEGDWSIKDINGFPYWISDEVFRKTYEEAKE